MAMVRKRAMALFGSRSPAMGIAGALMKPKFPQWKRRARPLRMACQSLRETNSSTPLAATTEASTAWISGGASRLCCHPDGEGSNDGGEIEQQASAGLTAHLPGRVVTNVEPRHGLVSQFWQADGRQGEEHRGDAAEGAMFQNVGEQEGARIPVDKGEKGCVPRAVQELGAAPGQPQPNRKGERHGQRLPHHQGQP